MNYEVKELYNLNDIGKEDPGKELEIVVQINDDILELVASNERRLGEKIVGFTKDDEGDFVEVYDSELHDDVDTEKLYNKIVAQYHKYNGKLKIMEEQRYDYMLLSRLKSDCDYFLGYGNGYEGRLWAGNIDDQIEKMKELHNILVYKPEWLTMEEIKQYKEKMINYEKSIIE